MYDSEEKWQAGPYHLVLTSHRLLLNQLTSKLEAKLQLITYSEIKKLERQSNVSGATRVNRQIITRVIVKFQDNTQIQIEFEFGGQNKFLDRFNKQLLRKH